MSLMDKRGIVAVLWFGITGLAVAQDHITSYQYDARGRIIQVTDDANRHTKWSYDDAGNRIAAADETESLTIEPEIVEFSTNLSTYTSGSTVYVSWDSISTTHCEIDGDQYFVNLGPSGTVSFRIYQNTALVLNCYLGQQSDMASKLVRISSGGGGGRPLN